MQAVTIGKHPCLGSRFSAACYWSGTQNLPRQIADMPSVLVKYFAVNDGIFDALRRHDQTPAAARQVVAHLGALGGIDRVVVQDRDVGGHARKQTSAVLDAEEIRRLRSDTFDREFQRERLTLAHPVPSR